MIRFLFIALVSFSFVACQSGKKATATAGPDDQHFQRKFFDAQQYKATQNEEKALEAFSECLSLQPDNAAVMYEIARIQGSNENVPGAIELMEKAVKIDAKNFWYLSYLTDLYMYMGDYDSAEKTVDRMIKLSPNDVEVLFTKSDILLMSKDYDATIKIYNEIEKSIGINQELSMQKQRLYFNMGKEEEAEKEMIRLAEHFPNDVDIQLVLAQMYVEKGEEEKANKIFEELGERFPNDGRIHLQLSEYYNNKGDDTRAFEELKIAFASTDVDIDTKIGVLMRFYTIGEFDSAVYGRSFELLDLCRDAHPEEAKIHAMHGDFLWRDNQANEALVSYHEALKFDKTRDLIWQQVLMIQMQSQLYNDMIIDGEQAVSLFPSKPEFYWYTGVAYAQTGQHEKATRLLSNGKNFVVENNDLYVQFCSTLGDSYHELKQYEKSDAVFDEALEINPDNVFILNNYSYYLSLRKQKLKKAAEMAARANELSPGRVSFQDTYAWVLYELGDYEKALKWIEAAANNGGSSDHTILDHYGDILIKLDRKEEAIIFWQMAIEVGGPEDVLQQKINENSANE